MKANLLVQDPGARAVRYAIDAIGAAAKGARWGQGIFAFATVEGVALLVNHPALQALTKSGSFDLIVGLDAITNRDTLESLLDIARRRRGFHPKVFWNSSGGLFHPKLSRFSHARREVWIVGSGNLTPRGLRDSMEMFGIIEGLPSELLSLAQTLDAFLAAHVDDIREIDKAALDRAAKNKPSRPVGSIEPTGSTMRARNKVTSTGASEPGRILVAELPRGGRRWQQANFDGATVASFFGVRATPESLHRDLFFTEVDYAGASVSEEVRHFTFTRSKNLRVQLAARNGETYPYGGRPIAAFREIKPRHFMYKVLFPKERGYARATRLLVNDAGEIRRHITTVGEVRLVWRTCPLLASE